MISQAGSSEAVVAAPCGSAGVLQRLDEGVSAVPDCVAMVEDRQHRAFGELASFEFAVVADADSAGSGWTRTVAEYEAQGYDAVFLSDHLNQRLAPLPALAAAAAVTDRIRLGTYVLNVGVRNPALFVRELATVDELSGGRLLVGLGAGWSAQDYVLAGIDPAPGPQRLERLTAAVDEFRRLADEAGWTPPLMLGGSRPSVLTLAGARADVVSVVPPLMPDGPAGYDAMLPERLDVAIGWVVAAAAERVVKPRLNHVVWHCFITPRPAPVMDALAAGIGCSADEVSGLPGFLVGSAEQIALELRRRRHRWGMSLITVPAAAARDFTAVIDLLHTSEGHPEGSDRDDSDAASGY